MRTLTRIGVVFALCIVLCIALLGVTLALLPDRHVRTLAIKAVSELSGREFHIGALTLEREFSPRLMLTDVTFANPDWAESEQLFEAASVDVTVDLSALLRGRLHLLSIASRGTRLNLQRRMDGAASWQFESGSGSIDLGRISVADTVLTDARVDYDDATNDQHHELAFESATLRAGDALPSVTFEATGTLDGLPIDLTLTADDPPADADTALQALSRELRMNATAGKLEISAAGRIDTDADAAPLSLDISAQLASLADVGELIGRDLPNIGPLDLTARVTGDPAPGSDGGLDVPSFRLTVSDPLVTVDANGNVDDILDTARASIDIDTRFRDLSILTALFGQPMPPEWGPFTAEATLEGETGRYSMSGIKATLDGASTALATGDIESLVPFDGMRLDAKASLATLTEISAFTEYPLPALGPMTGTGVVRWQDGHLSLSEARATHRSEVGIVVATGTIADLINFDGVRLRADADLPDFTLLELFTGTDLPPVDHVVASANLVSVDALDLSAHQLRVSAVRDDVEVVGKGSVDSIIQRGGVLDLELSAEVDSLARLDTLVGSTLPDFGPVKARAKLTGANQEIAFSDVHATLSDQALTIKAKNAPEQPLRVADLSLDALAFDLDVATPSLAQTARHFGMSSTLKAPAHASGRVTSTNGALSFANTRLDIGGSRLEGDVTLRHLGDADHATTLEGDVIIRELDLLALYDAPIGIRQPGADDEIDAEAGDMKLLSARALPFSSISTEDVRLTLDIRKLRSALFDISEASLKVTVSEGVIAIGPFSGVVNDGQATLDLKIDTNTVPSAVKIKVDLDQIDLARAGWLADSTLIENSGGAWLSFSLNGRGDSFAEIMASADGEGALYIEDLLFKKDALSLFSSDVLEQLADALNPYDKRKSQTHLHCTALTFQIEAGELDTPFGLAVDSDDFVVVGDADLDFGTERIEVEFHTRPKGGLGIGFNRVANLVELTGTLSSPSLTLSSTGLLEFGASVAAAIASSGATLLAEGLYDKSRANSDVCNKALGK